MRRASPDAVQSELGLQATWRSLLATLRTLAFSLHSTNTFPRRLTNLQPLHMSLRADLTFMALGLLLSRSPAGLCRRASREAMHCYPARARCIRGTWLPGQSCVAEGTGRGPAGIPAGSTSRDGMLAPRLPAHCCGILFWLSSNCLQLLRPLCFQAWRPPESCAFACCLLSGPCCHHRARDPPSLAVHSSEITSRYRSLGAWCASGSSNDKQAMLEA